MEKEKYKGMKIWAKTRENGEYATLNIGDAADGFRQLGAEVIKYNNLNEIMIWITRDDIVLDGILQCNKVFNKFEITPKIQDYPDCLNKFLGRKVWTDTIDSIASNENKWSAGKFVKPVEDKAFTGKIIKSISDLVGCGSCYENRTVLVSEPLDIKAEWRCFILHGEVLDIRPYGILLDRKDSWRYHYDINTLDKMLEEVNNWENKPEAFSMDIAVIKSKPYRHYNGSVYGDEHTVLIECNDAYALGNYGLSSVHYAKFIFARWSQLLNRPDMFNF